MIFVSSSRSYFFLNGQNLTTGKNVFTKLNLDAIVLRSLHLTVGFVGFNAQIKTGYHVGKTMNEDS